MIRFKNCMGCVMYPVQPSVAKLGALRQVFEMVMMPYHMYWNHTSTVVEEENPGILAGKDSRTETEKSSSSFSWPKSFRKW